MDIHNDQHHPTQGHNILYYKLIFTIFVVFILTATLYAKNIANNNNFRLIVTASYLNSIKALENLIVIDVRDKNVSLKNHIVNARNLPVSATFDYIKKDRVASLQKIQGLIRDAGITEENRVVFYDSGSLIDAARVFWVFEFYGHKKVSILDGGFQQWNKSDFETEKAPPKKYHPINIPHN